MLGSAYEKPSRRKNAAFAVFNAGNPLGFVFGCFVAGVATQLASWRATWWTLAVIYGLVLIVSFWALPPDQSAKVPLNLETLKKFDVVGMLLTVSGIGMFSAALGSGSEAPHGWTTPYVLVLLILGILLLVAFVFWEQRFEYPLLPMVVWKDRNFSLLIIIFSLGFLAFPVGIFWISLYFQLVVRYSPIEVAVHFLPLVITGTLLNIVAGAILHQVSNKLLMYIGAVGYTISFTLYAVSKYGITFWALLFPGEILTVFGVDLQFNVVNMYVMSSMPPSQQAVAGAILQTISKLTLTVSFGLATAIFNAVEAHPATSGYYAGNPAEPYAAVFWYCAGLSALSVLFVPFLTIKTQGGKAHPVEDVEKPVGAPAALGVQASGMSHSLTEE